MTRIVTIDKSNQNSCEATGHPKDNCTEPVPGQIQKESTHSVTVTSSDGTVKQVATIDSAVMHFDSHSHDFSVLEGCHENASHDIDPDPSKLSSLTINGSRMYIVKDNVTTDPKTGDPVNIIGSGINTSAGNN